MLSEKNKFAEHIFAGKEAAGGSSIFIVHGLIGFAVREIFYNRQKKLTNLFKRIIGLY